MHVLESIATFVVILCWPVYLWLFVGRSGPRTERQRQDSSSKIGIILQGASVAVTWAWRRPLFAPLAVTFPLSIMAPVMAAMLAVGSVWFSHVALQYLGKQWSFVAGVTAGHRLVREGPYAVVRHPLYTSFFGLTLSTAIVWSRPVVFPVVVAMFWIGVWIRVRAEERILRQTFGAEFDGYAAEVAAFFPRFRDLL